MIPSFKLGFFIVRERLTPPEIMTFVALGEEGLFFETIEMGEDDLRRQQVFKERKGLIDEIGAMPYEELVGVLEDLQMRTKQARETTNAGVGDNLTSLEMCEAEIRATPLLKDFFEEAVLSRLMEIGREASETLSQQPLNAVQKEMLQDQVKKGKEARDVFIESNLRLALYAALWIFRRAHKLVGAYTLDLGRDSPFLIDLIGEANKKLIELVENYYDWRRGFRFSNLAFISILRTLTSMAKEECFGGFFRFNHYDIIREIYRTIWELRDKGINPTCQAIALAQLEERYSKIPPGQPDEWPPHWRSKLTSRIKTVQMWLEISRLGPLLYLDRPVKKNDPLDETDGYSLYATTADNSLRPDRITEMELLRQELNEFLEYLPENRRMILLLRSGLWDGIEHTQEEVAKILHQMGITERETSRQNIDNVERKTLDSLQLYAEGLSRDSVRMVLEKAGVGGFKGVVYRRVRSFEETEEVLNKEVQRVFIRTDDFHLVELEPDFWGWRMMGTNLPEGVRSDQTFTAREIFPYLAQPSSNLGRDGRPKSNIITVR